LTPARVSEIQSEIDAEVDADAEVDEIDFLNSLVPPRGAEMASQSP
jgi:hypothetical protein